MKRLYRRVLLFSATVIFLALAPLVIFYAMGYRSGTTTADPVPVGVVLLESFPRRADVQVRGQALGRTPRAIPNVSAGDVPVEVSKEGYASWKKNVPVRPGLVTELRGIRLFPADHQPAAVLADAVDFTVSPTGRLIAAVDQARQLHLLDQTGAELAVFPLREPVTRMVWSSTTSTLLIQGVSGTVDYVDAAVTGARPQRLPALAGATDLMWDRRIPGRVLTLNKAGAVRAYNLSTQASSTITTGAAAVAVTSRQIYVARPQSIDIFTLQGQRSRSIPWPPENTEISSSVSQLLVHDRGSLAVRTTDNQLLLWDDTTFVPVAERVTLAEWSPDGNILLVQTEANALYAYNVTDERSPLPVRTLQLIIRLSRPITHPRWFAGGQHVIYQIDDEIHITETDTRDYPVSYQADTTNRGNAKVVVGEDGTALWYLKQTDGTSELTHYPLVLESDL